MLSSSIINIPNSITILRMFLVVPLVYFLINNNIILAISTFIVASFSDIVDGFLARKMGCITKFGTVLDPVADKMLINYTLLIFTIENKIPQFLFFTIFIKDMALIVGSAMEIFSKKQSYKTTIKVSIFGKLTTFSQVLLIFIVFFEKLDIFYDRIMLNIFIWVTLMLSILSFVLYAFRLKKTYYEDVYYD